MGVTLPPGMVKRDPHHEHVESRGCAHRDVVTVHGYV
jgi:hypothetical protein